MKTKNTFLSFATLIMLLFNTFNSEAQSLEKTMNVITPKEAYDMVESGVLFVDVREKDEVATISYDVPNIINIPLSEIKENFTQITKDKKVILVCKSGNRSGQAYEFLTTKGFDNIVNMDGGMNLWNSSGLPVLNSKIVKKACCAKPNSKDCNPDGTCKPKLDDEKKADCPNKKSKTNKACCSSKKAN